KTILRRDTNLSQGVDHLAQPGRVSGDRSKQLTLFYILRDLDNGGDVAQFIVQDRQGTLSLEIPEPGGNALAALQHTLMAPCPAPCEPVFRLLVTTEK